MPCQDIIKHIEEDAAKRRRKQEERPILAPGYPMPKVQPDKIPAGIDKDKEKAR